MKNQLIKPRVWPKEYTFEEFKRLNPNINENLLINYYNKYLYEYAEDRSRHLKHFNNTKQQLGEEIRLLKNQRNWDYDGDQTVGPTGAGRVYQDNTYSKSSIHFNAALKSYAISTNRKDLAPSLFTISLWMKADDYTFDGTGEVMTIVDNYVSGRGFEIKISTFGSISIIFESSKNDVTYSLGTYYAALQNKVARAYYDTTGPDGSGWFNVVFTMDGRYLKLYINGELDVSNSAITYGTKISHGNSYTNSAGNTFTNGGYLDMDGTSGHTVSYHPYNASGDENLCVLGGYLGSPHVGNSNTKMDEVAIWDIALDGDTIRTLYNSGVPKYDLNVNSPYDGYKFYKPHVNNLKAWWRFEEGSGTTAKDSSPLENDLVLINTPTWSTSTPE